MPFQINIVGFCFCLYFSLFLSWPLLSSFPFLFAFGLRFYYSSIMSSKICHNVRDESQGILSLSKSIYYQTDFSHSLLPGLRKSYQLNIKPRSDLLFCFSSVLLFLVHSLRPNFEFLGHFSL